MTLVEAHRQAFAHETVANHAMLHMLAGVNSSMRNDPRFQRAVNIAYHMVACRRNYLHLMTGADEAPEPWFIESCDLATLSDRFHEMEQEWREYLALLDDPSLEGFFTFWDNGSKWKMKVYAQIMQLSGHAAYHRGQVVLLVDQLGGEIVDTDFIAWFEQNVPGGCGAAN